ncbi:MAG: hypothetical protein K0R38_7170, partial [Polyangiaceae bacterium]|nr:hypothetical protein [Polyangiaceae bacterium]
MKASELTIPAILRAETEAWLSELEQRVSALQASASQLEGGEAHMLTEASCDTMNALTFARRTLAGDVPLGPRPKSPWVPVKNPSRALAKLVHSHGDKLGGTPWAVVELANTCLPEAQRRPVLWMIGDVRASVVTNLTRAVWN